MRVTYCTKTNRAEVNGEALMLEDLERLIRVLQDVRRRMLKEAKLAQEKNT